MIYVLDAMCGAGKSTSMINSIRGNMDKKWIYITPFLSEIEERLPRVIPEANFKSPIITKDSVSKLESIKVLLSNGDNISTTHALFKLLDRDAVNMILDKQYCIVIDEAVDAVSEYREGLNKTDIHALLTGDFLILKEDERNRVYWNEDKYPEHTGKYADVRKVCMNSMLYLYNGTFLMCEYPPELLSGVDHCYVLTYMFRCSSMRYWLDISGIKYDYVTHKQAMLRSEDEIKADVRANLKIISNRTLDKVHRSQRNTAFSKRWFTSVKPETLRKYRGIMRSCMVAHKVNGCDIFWTTYNESKDKLIATGYKNNHLPVNTKATNKYKDKSFCVYAANMFPNVVDGNYIKSLGVTMTDEDVDSFTLSNLLQFIFRGTIRQNKKMKVLILSKRVKMLLEKWLYED